MKKKQRKRRHNRPPQLRLLKVEPNWFVVKGGGNQAPIEGTGDEWRFLHNDICARTEEDPPELQEWKLQAAEKMGTAIESARAAQPNTRVVRVTLDETISDRVAQRRQLTDCETHRFLRCAARVLLDGTVELWSPRNRYRAVDVVTVQPDRVEHFLASIQLAVDPPPLH